MTVNQRRVLQELASCEPGCGVHFETEPSPTMYRVLRDLLRFGAVMNRDRGAGTPVTWMITDKGRGLLSTEKES